MNCLITGGAGFIGSHLTEYLLSQGHTVFVYDNLSSGSLSNLQSIWGNDRLVVVEGDILDIPKLAPILANCEEVYHLAAVEAESIPRKTLEAMLTNIQGTEHVLNLASCFGSKVLITSSQDAFGRIGPGGPVADVQGVSSPMENTRRSYMVAKAADELFAHAYHWQRGLHAVVVRLFCVIGPRQFGFCGSALPRFVRQALTGAPLTVFGGGLQKRNLLGVEDAVQALVRLMREPAARGEIVNIGSPVATRLIDLATIVKEVTGSESPIRSFPYAATVPVLCRDLSYRAPDLRKAKRLIGFRPQTDLRDVVRSVVEHIQAHESLHISVDRHENR